MDDHSYLPPGFRFHPTDEEIITHYLMKKIADQNFFSVAIGQANFNDCEPWDLPRKANMGDKEWYFFCQKDRKYPTGMRTNRATKAGYWKTTGKDKEIFKGKRVLLGKKKTLVFYKGRAPRGQRTNWVMHEYRLEGKHQVYYNLSKSPQMQEEWVVCKVHHKMKDTKISPSQEFSSKMNSFVDDMLVENPQMPPLLNSPCFNSSNQQVEWQQGLENELIFSTQSYFLGPWFLHQEEGKLRAPFISNHGSFVLNVAGKVEQSSNCIASTSYDTGLSTGRNGEASSVLDFDSILNYEMV